LGGAKGLLAFLKGLRSDSTLWLHLITTTAEEIRNGVVAMGEMLLSCCLYGEIMARQHGPALSVT
jgi:hypothetical protein